MGQLSIRCHTMPGVSEQPPVSRRQPALETLSLQRLLADRADLWRGRVQTSALAEGMTSGFTVLDQALPWDGWPTNGLTELLTDQPGAGLSLILLALVRLCAESRHAPGSETHQSAEQTGRSSRHQTRSRPQKKGLLLLVNSPFIPRPLASAAPRAP